MINDFVSIVMKMKNLAELRTRGFKEICIFFVIWFKIIGKNYFQFFSTPKTSWNVFNCLLFVLWEYRKQDKAKYSEMFVFLHQRNLQGFVIKMDKTANAIVTKIRKLSEKLN